MSKLNNIKGYTFVILSAVIYGLMPLMAKYIYAEGVSAFSLVFLRNFIALPVLAVLSVLNKQPLKISFKEFTKISVIGIFGCLITPVLIFISYNYIASGTVTVLHYIYPAIVIVISALFLKQKQSITNIISVAICIIGILLFYNPAEPINLKGGALALLSGITFAIYVVLLSNFKNRKTTGFAFGFYISLACSIVMLIICLATNRLTLPKTLFGWSLTTLFAIAISVGAVVLFQQGTFIIGGEKASILATAEPITSVIVGALIFNEILNLRTVFGTVLVILASILIAISDIRKQKEKELST